MFSDFVACIAALQPEGRGECSRFTAFAVALLFCSTLCGQVESQPSEPQLLTHGFEDDTPIAQIASQNLIAATVQHALSPHEAHTGTGSELFLFQTPAQPAEESRLVIPVPKARVFNELTARLWIRTNCLNARLGLRIRFPHQLDPRTSAPLEIDFFGQPCAITREWQQLSCQTLDEKLQSRLIRVRSQLADGINPVRLDEREAYVDQILIQLQLPAGQSGLQFDDLEFGPIVRAETVIPEPSVNKFAPSKLTIENDRIRKNGEPFFPIMTLYHAEPLDLIARTGVNMLWIRDYSDRPLLEALEGMDIGAVAYPPQPPPAEAILNRSALPSMPEWTSPIWAWMLGINVPPSDRAYVTAWADQVRNADRRVHRPIIVDVAGEERDFHRKVDLISVGRLQMHTSHNSFDHYQDLRNRRAYALPGKQMMTFVQTEASGPLLDYLGDRTNIPIVEPEQILHQGFEAIAAGFKGIGFWKQIPFDTDAAGLNERLDAIRIFSIQGRLLEPFLATGRVIDEVMVQVESKQGYKSKALSSPLATRWDRPLNSNGQVTPGLEESPEIRATVFRSDHGLLILLVWHEPGAQCVPGPQTATSVRVLISGIGDVATAWEVTPTSVGQSNLQMDRIAGGTELTVKSFDQYAAIIVTGGPQDANAIRALSQQLQKPAAESYVNLAESKLVRVRDIHGQLESVGAPPVLNAEKYLALADRFLQEARKNLSTDRFDEARVASQRCLQQLRTLQRLHWELAIAPMTGPTTTLEATSFQTLPDHWKLISGLSQTLGSGENLLPSGDFEDENALSAGSESGTGNSWSTRGPETGHSSIRLVRGSAGPGTHLAMIVKPDAPAGQSAALVSPQIEIAAEDILIISGDVKIPHPLNGPDHQFRIFDTLAGQEGAIILKQKTEEWTPFRLIRKAPKAGSFRVRFELDGAGIANVDNLQVRIIPATQIQQTSR